MYTDYIVTWARVNVMNENFLIFFAIISLKSNKILKIEVNGGQKKNYFRKWNYCFINKIFLSTYLKLSCLYYFYFSITFKEFFFYSRLQFYPIPWDSPLKKKKTRQFSLSYEIVVICTVYFEKTFIMILNINIRNKQYLRIITKTVYQNKKIYF